MYSFVTEQLPGNSPVVKYLSEHHDVEPIFVQIHRLICFHYNMVLINFIAKYSYDVTLNGYGTFLFTPKPSCIGFILSFTSTPEMS